MTSEIRVGFAGNPNCGKTTLFNAYTGANLKVANWPGVTVEKKEGETEYKGRKMRLIDLPGIYSLTSYSMEEKVSRKVILGDDVDIIVDVVDASALERNLYLTLQLLELGKPVVVALNMMDIVEERGMEIDLHRLPELLGNIPVVPVSARKRTGLDVLLHAVEHHYEEQTSDPVVEYSPEIEEKIRKISGRIQKQYPESKNLRWHSIKILENDEQIIEEQPVDISDIADKNYEKQIINEKYSYIEEIIEECVFYKGNRQSMTEKADRVLTHPVAGVPVFLCIMALVFFLTFTVGDAIKGWFEIGLDWAFGAARTALTALGASGWVCSLVVDGIMSGVGGILTFLPNIFILFLALAFLEDSGYMARVAYVMDGIMGKVGLSGKAFLPMVLGFGCTVPAVMATRTLENEEDRKKTILLTPFMSCSAKLPIYSLFAYAFFGTYGALVMIGLYIFGIIAGIVFSLILKHTGFKGNPVPFVLELPNYRMPSSKSVGQLIWEKTKDFVTRAFTIIFVASIVIWFLQSFDSRLNPVADSADSMLAALASLISPIFRPLGFGDWRISTALITGFMAKESVVATLSVLLGDSLGALSSFFTPFTALVFLVFTLLYTPCVAAIATVRRELGRRWALGVVILQCVVAWVAAFLVHLIGSIFI